jgi:hypothetical protein
MDNFTQVYFNVFFRLNRQKTNSIIDAYFGEIGRILDGKLGVPRFTFLNRVIIVLRSFWIGYKINQLTSKGTSWNGGVIICVSEPSHIKQLKPIYYNLSGENDARWISFKINMLELLKSENLPILKVNLPFIKNSGLSNAIKNDMKKIDMIGLLSADLKSHLSVVKFNYKQLVYFYNHIVVENKIKTILVGNDLTPEGRIFSRCAAKMGIKIHSIQHGYVAQDRLQKFHVADVFFTYGELSKASLEIKSLSSTKFITSGACYLENIDKQGFAEEFDKIINHLGFSDPYILVALSGYGHLTSRMNYNKILNLLFEVIKLTPNIKFVVKLHRKENIEDYAEVKNFSNVNLISNTESEELGVSIFGWLNFSSLLITGNSSVSFEAFWLSKPVVSIDLNNEYSEVEYRVLGASANVYSSIELLHEITKIYEGKRSRIEREKVLVTSYFGNSEVNVKPSKFIADYLLQNSN